MYCLYKHQNSKSAYRTAMNFFSFLTYTAIFTDIKAADIIIQIRMLWCGAASCNLLEGLRMINVCRSTAQYMTMVAELNSLCEAKDTTENTANAEIILFIAEHCFVNICGVSRAALPWCLLLGYTAGGQCRRGHSTGTVQQTPSQRGGQGNHTQIYLIEQRHVTLSLL